METWDCKTQTPNHQQLGGISSDFDNMEPVPSCTLYINNINEKIKQDVVKKMLYMVFSQYGKVTDVIAKKGLKLRGQAWVVFENESSAISALRGKQGFSFYEKPLVSSHFYESTLGMIWFNLKYWTVCFVKFLHSLSISSPCCAKFVEGFVIYLFAAVQLWTVNAVIIWVPSVTAHRLMSQNTSLLCSAKSIY